MIGVGKSHDRTEPAQEEPGLPGLRTWRAVYVFVLGCFVLYVVALAALTRWSA